MKFSIITVVYNNDKYLETAIQSVRLQDYKDIEYIVIDGGSTDNTLEIISKSSDVISYYASEPDKGIYDAMNKGLDIAKGDVVSILNSDDFFRHKNSISSVAQIFRDDPNLDMVLGGVDFVDPKDLTHPTRPYPSYNFSPWKMRFGFMPPHPGSFIKKAAYDRVGDYQLNYKIGSDFEWFVRAFYKHRVTYKTINTTLVRMRSGGVSTSGIVSNWIISKEILCALKENGVHSNILFVLIRLPVKYFSSLFWQVGSLINNYSQSQNSKKQKG